jgi:RNA polymerase sigma-54 factor
MEIQAGVEVSQRTQLVMTARMQQSLSVLQAAGIELAAVLREALNTNPFLEEEFPEEPLPLTGESPDGEQDGALSAAVPAVAPWGREDRSRPALPVAAHEPWQERLVRQLRLRRGGERDAALAEYLLGCLDERGYLALSVAEIARGTGVRPERLEAVRQLVLRLDPPGLAALDLRECLMVQLQVCGEEGSLACRIVAGGLPDLARQRFDRLARSLEASREEVLAAARRIRRLWPHPRRLAEPTGAQPVYPDLRVERIDGRLEVLLNDRHLPRVRFAPPGSALLRRRDAQLRAFIADRLARARWLLASLDARRRTLLGLMRLIVEEQWGFFEKGAGALRPLGYRQLANRMGLHESTVARAVRGKYVQTPRGVFPLRFFFAKGLPTAEGDSRSPVGVRLRLRELIAAEDAARPLTDEELRRLLRRDGVCISRRTVAKYRDAMRIPKAAFRRRSRP